MMKNPIIPNTSPRPIIKVIGVGGGGGQAVQLLKQLNIHSVDLYAVDTSLSALNYLDVPCRIHIGEGKDGTGGKVDKGREYIIAHERELTEILAESTEMLFVAAMFGKGTGTGAAPTIAKIAKSLGILTVGVVATPLRMNGLQQKRIAEEGIRELRECVDALIVISNEKVKEQYKQLGVSEASKNAHMVLATAVRGVAEIVTGSGYVNVDMNDVKTTLTDKGDAILGIGDANGPDRAVKSIMQAISSPLLINNDFSKLNDVLLNISYTDCEPTMDEVSIITDKLRSIISPNANMIFGVTKTDGLEDKISVTLVATGKEYANIEETETHIIRTTQIVTPQPAIKKEETKNEEKSYGEYNMVGGYVLNQDYGAVVTQGNAENEVGNETATEEREVSVGTVTRTRFKPGKFEWKSKTVQAESEETTAQNSVEEPSISSMTFTLNGDGYSLTSQSYINDRPD